MNVSPSASYLRPSAPRRILYVITLGWWGGAQRYVYDIATASKEAGDEVLVLTGDGELAHRLRDAGVAVRVTPHFARGIQLIAEWHSFLDLMRTIREFRPDVIHVNSSKLGLFGSLAARIIGVRRIIFTAHVWVFTDRRPWWPTILFWLAQFLTVLLADITITVHNDI